MTIAVFKSKIAASLSVTVLCCDVSLLLIFSMLHSVDCNVLYPWFGFLQVLYNIITFSGGRRLYLKMDKAVREASHRETGASEEADCMLNGIICVV